MTAQLTDLFPTFQQITGPCGTIVTGKDLNALIQEQFSNNAGAPITAHGGGGQTGATPCTKAINIVSTVATAADSVLLPPAIPGRRTMIINHGAASCQVFGVPANPNNAGIGDTIAAHGATTQTATGTGVAQASAAVGIYVCFNTGQWKQLLLT